MKKYLSVASDWQRLFNLSILVSYFLVFMEWVFFVTKPSFMDAMNFSQKVAILFVSGGIVAIVSVLLFVVFWVVNLLVSRFAKPSNALLAVACVVPGIILAVLALLLLDNFTYTIFRFGIVSTSGILRGVYALVFLYFVYYFVRWVFRFVQAGQAGVGLKTLYISSMLLALITAGFVLGRSRVLPSQEGSAVRTNDGKLPNILILGSDGINASNTSLYGYERETTPFLTHLSESSLFVENAFTNAGTSTGSVTSMLTGKLPIETRVMYSPNILTGTDAYEHLPGILRRMGYYTAEIGVSQYVDSYQFNFQDAFDFVNGRSMENDPFFQLGRKLGFADAFYFIPRIFERVSDRLLHIFYIKKMDNTFKLVTESQRDFIVSDKVRVNELLDMIASHDQPVFLHVHLMGTHGARFYPENRVFSANEAQTEDWMPDFYDDAILDFDGYVKKVYRRLAASGELENTIIVIYTDHNQRYQTTQRIPLMFYFPDGQHVGRIHNNVQLMDIAPTLLDYLGVSIPPWMMGQSVLHGEPASDRLIFSARLGEVDPEKYQPPFYQFGTFTIVRCDQAFEYVSGNDYLINTPVHAHTSPCADQVTTDFISAQLLRYLQAAKFDFQSIPTKVVNAP